MKIKVSCPSCRTKFALDGKRVPATGLRIKCPKCTSAFSVQPPKPGEEGKVVMGVPHSTPGPVHVSAQDAAVDQTIVESRPLGDGAGADAIKPGSRS